MSPLKPRITNTTQEILNQDVYIHANIAIFQSESLYALGVESKRQDFTITISTLPPTPSHQL